MKLSIVVQISFLLCLNFKYCIHEIFMCYSCSTPAQCNHSLKSTSFLFIVLTQQYITTEYLQLSLYEVFCVNLTIPPQN